MTEEDPPNFFNILLYMAAGAFITYIWLNKSKGQVQSANTEYLLYSQNNELLENLKLLNETLNRRDNLLNEYYKTSQQQYQNIPTVIGSAINTELQQIALYLDAVNTQLEQINNQIKQVLEVQNQSHNKENRINNDGINNLKASNEDNFQTNIINKNYRDNIRPLTPKNYHEKSRNVNKNENKDENKNDKWSVKRGTDGRIKSLQTVQKINI